MVARRVIRAVIGGTLVAAAFAGNAASGVNATVTASLPGLCDVSAAVSTLLGCPSQQEHSAPSSSSATSTSTENTRTTASAAAPAAQLMSSPAIAKASATPAYVPHVVVVRFRDGVSARAKAQLLHRIGARTREAIPQLGVAVVSVASVQRAQAKLDASPLVMHATRDEVMHVLGSVPDDTFFSYQWGFRQAGFGTIWRPAASRNVIVAVVDTGVDASQPDLAGVVRPEVNLISGSTVSGDDNGHGTAV